MLIAKGFQEIYNTLDFTDSIVEEIKWKNNLSDLVLMLDYYNTEKEDEEILKLRFTDCIKADFSLSNKLLSASDEEKDSYRLSWYTIQSYKLVEESELLKKYNNKYLIHF